MTHIAPYRFAPPCLTDEWGHPLKQPAGALRLAGRPVNFSRAAQLFELNLFHFVSNSLLYPTSKINPDRFSIPNLMKPILLERSENAESKPVGFKSFGSIDHPR